MKRVVVTGIGVVSPVASGVDKFWSAIKAGKSGIGPITAFDASDYTARIAGEVDDVDYDAYVSKKDQRRFDKFCQFGLIAAKMAAADSGIDFDSEDHERAGASISAGIGGLQTLEKQHKILLNKGPSRCSPFMITQMIINMASGLVGIDLHLQGPNYSVVSACASSAHGIGEAANIIRRGDADIMVAGGAEASICTLGIGGFCAMKALSTRNDEPEKASRPFDLNRDGFVMGEGAAVLILEEYDRAVRRGANIYCELAGFGMTCDAYHMTAPLGDGSGAARAITMAMKTAGLGPDDVDYINAHGTSTSLNDAGETKAMKLALGEDRARKIPVSSTKSMTGHVLGAAGAIESVVCSLAIRDGVVPPTINYETPDPDCDLDYVPNEAREADVKVCLNNSLGFGGHNASLLFKKI